MSEHVLQPEKQPATAGALTTAQSSEEPVADPAKTEVAQEAVEEAEVMKWRYRVLPQMQSILYFVTAIFFLSGLLQLGYLQWSISQGGQIDRQELPVLAPQYAESNQAELLDAAYFDAAVILESYIVERRYHQANTLLMTMAWIRYLGFSTGMILAIVGASFILGMLREKETSLTTESAGWKVSLRSSSPGLVMVILGTILMLTTIAVRQDFNLQDRPVYYQTPAQVIDEESDTDVVVPLPDYEE